MNFTFDDDRERIFIFIFILNSNLSSSCPRGKPQPNARPAAAQVPAGRWALGAAGCQLVGQRERKCTTLGSTRRVRAAAAVVGDDAAAAAAAPTEAEVSGSSLPAPHPTGGKS